MILIYVTASVLLAIVAYQARYRFMTRRRRRVMEQANAAGAEFDADGNINARASYSRLREEEKKSGQQFTGKQAQFMELTRLVAEGPKTPDEIRLLLNAGFEPMVRPDGLVYVPCVENEHLSMDGEIPLAEEDLTILEE